MNRSTTRYSRRQVCQFGVGGIAGLSMLGLAACGGPGGSATNATQPKTLQLDFWGGTSRDKLTKKAITAFQQQNPSITIKSQFTDFTSYWKKLSTQIAGGTLPDLIQMDLRYIQQYVSRNLLTDMTQFTSDKTVDISDFDTSQVAGCKVGNVLSGISLGGNYQVMIADATLIDKAGVGAPPKDMTWDTFADYTASITKGLGGSIYGIGDSSGDLSTFEIWLRQRGKELYTTDGKLAFVASDVADWFSYWDNVRKKGGCIPASVAAAFANASGAANSPLIHGKSVFVTPHSNEFEGYQQLTKDKLALYPLPLGPGPGMFFKVSMLMSISSKTKYTKECANFINFLVNDPAGVKALGLDRGVPASAKARSALLPTLNAVQKEVMDYVNMISSGNTVRTKTVLDPAAAGQVQDTLSRVAQAVSFGQTSITAGANSFVSDAQKALAQG